ncbi:MAG: hypothetical protein HGA44_18265, partial [Cellulomonadaceae bacterium]|nr:hypothetical protein [Cellulomonadaceae bacterium]
MTSAARTSPSRAARRLRAVAGATALLTIAGAAPASAHERWFADLADGGDWGFFFSPLPMVLTVVVVAATVAWRVAGGRLPRPELPFLAPVGRLTPYIPRLLAIHLGVALLAFAVTGSFLTPSLPLADVPGHDLAGFLEAAVGIWLITGV